MDRYVIHLTGKVCSGKSYILQKFDIPVFDMSDFYLRHECEDDVLKMQEALILYLKDEVLDFTRINNVIVAIESSGIGYHLSKVLAQLPCIELNLLPPDEITLLNRLSMRGYSSEKLKSMIDLNNLIDKKSADKPKLDQEYISRIIGKLLK